MEAVNDVDLDFTSEQELLRDMVRGVCERYCDLTVVRRLEDDPVGYEPAFWDQLRDLGLLGMTIPEEHGGSGMSMLDAAVVYTELGRALAPSPHFASSVVAATALRGRADWLERIASGDAIVVPAWLEPDGGYRPAGLQIAVDGDRLTGVKRHVPFASSAARLLVVARDGLYLVDPAAEGVTMTQQKTIASDCQYEVVFEGAPAERIDSPTWHEVMLDAVILAAAQAVGGARYALDITVQYAKDRHQFDKPLGAFQALAHYLADGVTAIDGAETLVWEAAWARTAGRSTERLAPMAKLFACRTFRDITAVGQQIFGGIGFTLDYDIQLYFRRAKAWPLGLGRPAETYQQVADLLFGPTTAS